MNRIYDIAPEDVYQTPYTRGTSDWAPPRAQIIFTRHLPPDRKKVIQMQNNRCAGCGMYVAAALQYSLRYCEYLGKYHCTGCHRNQISAIPARVLDRYECRTATFHFNVFTIVFVRSFDCFNDL